MGKLKNNFFKRKLSPTIGYFCSFCYVKSALISLILVIISAKLSNSTLTYDEFGSTLVSCIINVIFYLMVANYFRKGKTEFDYTYRAMIILTLATYIIPFILNVIAWGVASFSVANTTGWILILISIILGAILGIAYFVLMINETKQNKKSYNIGMIVLGIFISIIALYTMIVSIYTLSTTFEKTAIGIVTLIINIYSEVILFLFSFLYLLYAYDVYRIRNGTVY